MIPIDISYLEEKRPKMNTNNDIDKTNCSGWNILLKNNSEGETERGEIELGLQFDCKYISN